MKYSKNIKIALAAASALMASSVGAQTFTVEDVTAAVGSSSVEVSWSWTAGADVTSIAVDIAYDSTVLTPQVSGGEATGCISAAVTAAVANASCQVPVAGTIAITLSNNANDVPSFSPGGSITFDVASGTTASTEVLDLSVFDVSPSGTSVTLNDGSVEFVVIAPALSVNPTSASFTAENGSTSGPATFTVTNTGNADDLTLTAALSGSDASKYSIASNNCPESAPGVAQNGTCTIQVQFSPDAIATFNDANLVLTSNGGNATVDLDGEGTAGPAGAITITPAGPFDFGKLLTGIEEETQVFTATNTGAAGSVVTISSAALNLLFGSPLSIVANTCANGTELEKDETCLVTVKEAPIATGTAERTLTVSGTDANGTQLSDSVTIKGEGIEEARPTSNPAAGTSAASQSEIVGPEGSNDFTVVWGNAGNVPYDLSCALSGNDTSNVWSLADATATVAADGSHTVTTTCALPDTETYTETLTCTVTNPDQETLTYTHNYECVGLPPLPVPVDNNWALALLALMMLMAASFGFRFIARQ